MKDVERQPWRTPNHPQVHLLSRLCRELLLHGGRGGCFPCDRRVYPQDMANADRASIDAFLQGHRIALAGLSTNPEDFSRAVDKELVAHGYEVIPVHPGVTEIGGRPAYARVSEIPGGVDGVLVMTPPSAVHALVKDCVAAGKPRMWLHRGIGQGSVSEEAVDAARAEGIDVVVGECPLMFLPNAARPHRVHAVAKKIAGTYPYHEGSIGRTVPPLSAGSALSLIAVDWFIYASTMLLGLPGLSLGTALGALAAGLATLRFEGRAGQTSNAMQWTKAAASAVLVAIPLPIMGSVVGLAALVWRALNAPKRDLTKA